MKQNSEKLLTAFYFALYFAVVLSIALNQPLYDTLPYLQNPPDEHSRYLVSLYICNHGTIPTGFEEELFSGGLRWTYGFYTLLPYIVQGYAMRVVKLFVTEDPLILLYTGRMVNVILGAVMAYVVLLLGRKLFADRRLSWLFSFLVTFLPQSIFLHTYVNPDSMALLSTAVILYGLVRGYGDGFCIKSCLILSAGIVLCALSYYNAYGSILGAIIVFAAYFVRREGGKWSVAGRELLRKGLGISAVVLLCISWQFIRNYILYDGDFIGLETKENYIKSFGIARDSLQSTGVSLFEMLTDIGKYDFWKETWISFIAKYGAYSINAPIWVYVFFTVLLVGGAGSALLLRRKNPYVVFGKDAGHRMAFHAGMALSVVIPFLLLVKYAYTIDFQTQGRYLMPALLPIMFYVVYGLEKTSVWQKSTERTKSIAAAVLIAGIAAAVLAMLMTAMPYYLQTSVLGS